MILTGPRQTGKTFLVKAIATGQKSSVYLNYDIPEDKRRIIENPTFFEDVDRYPDDHPLVVLDELHKYKDWKNYLKGIYDGFADTFRFLVTGSGRLDLYQRRGDALAARFRQFHLFPFTLGELFGGRIRESAPGRELFEPVGSGEATEKVLADLLRCSGFPEPFLSGRERTYRRWANAYHRQIVRDDIRDALAVRDIDTMELLYALLAPRTGSRLSIASLAGILKVSHKTISSWITVFERLGLVFRISPYSRRVSRSILKAKKLYFYDYGRVEEEAKRFENLVAVELFRAVKNWTDYGLGDFRLHYLGNKEQEEVDFLVTRASDPFFMVEVKSGALSINRAILKFQSLINVPAVQLVRRGGVSRPHGKGSDRILVASAGDWLARLR